MYAHKCEVQGYVHVSHEISVTSENEKQHIKPVVRGMLVLDRYDLS